MNTEHAYEQIAKAMLSAAEGEAWTSLVLLATVYDQMVSGRFAVWNDDKADKSRYIASPASEAVLDAALFLRDDLLKTTGDRISGFTFTLHKDGKFNIDYRYGETED
jgi:hypothetical protein